MGREVKRVALDWEWPIDKTWEGYLNPHYTAKKCHCCDGSGYSPQAQRLHDLWYGKIPFDPKDRGSTPFLPSDPHVADFAKRNVERNPEFYGKSALAADIEANRLCRHWNMAWCHHLNADDVAALVASGRLHDFTHTFTPGKGWVEKNPPVVPSPRDVNIWSCTFMGHDSVNCWVVIKAECERRGDPVDCAVCNGEGDVWPSPEAKKAYDDWLPTEPPAGDGWQIWETVSEGSPISPVFSTPEDLAKHMATTRWGADRGTPYETWLAFIRGPAWAPSMVVSGGRVMDGVTAVTDDTV